MGAVERTSARGRPPPRHLVFSGTTDSEYGLLIDLKSPTEWTLVITRQPRQAQFDANNKTDAGKLALA